MSGGQNLRVTHIVSGDLWAGAEVQCFQLLRSLAEDGAVSPRAIVLNEGELASRAAAAGIEVCVIPEARHTPVELYRRITRELRAQAPQLVHTHRGKENIIGSLAARSAGVAASIRTAHGASEHAPAGLAPRKRLLGWLDRLAAQRWQRRVVAVSDDLAGQLREQFGAERVTVIRNGIDVARTLAEAHGAALPGRPDTLKIGFIGRLAPVKRLDVFLGVAAALHAALPGRIEFYVIGDGPDAPRARAALGAATLPLHVLGFRRDALPLLRGLHALLLTSDHEGTPMVVLEAMCLRVLVAAHAVGGLPALLGGGSSGLLVPSQRPEEWVARLAPLLTDAARRDELTEQGYSAVNAHWSAAANARQYAQLYRECVAEAQGESSNA